MWSWDCNRYILLDDPDYFGTTPRPPDVCTTGLRYIPKFYYNYKFNNSSNYIVIEISYSGFQNVIINPPETTSNPPKIIGREGTDLKAI